LRGVRMNRGSRNVRYRLAASPGWRASLTLVYTSPNIFGRGLLTTSFPDPPPATAADGNILNAGGTPNDAAHPAALGLTVTLYANGSLGPPPVQALAVVLGAFDVVQRTHGRNHPPRATSTLDPRRE
jgi:hypothetical protein